MGLVEKLFVSVGAKTDDLKSGLDQAKSMLVKFAGAAGLAFGGRELAQFTQQAVKLSGVAEGVGAAFTNLGKPGLLDNLVRATKGTVSQLELMQQAVRADNFKIPLDVLAQGLEFATRRAKETGESVDFLVNSFVSGIGRKSALVMDNLGISATTLQAEIKKVGDFAVAVGNIMTREMSGAGEAVDSVSDKTARLSANFENTKKIIGDIVTEVGNLKDKLDGVNVTLSSINTVLASDQGGGLNKNLKFLGKILTDTNMIFLISKGTMLAWEKVADRINKKAAEIRRGSGGTSGQPFAVDIPTPSLIGPSQFGTLPEDRAVTLEKLKNQLAETNDQIALTNILDQKSIIVLQNKAAAISANITEIEGLGLANAKLVTTGDNLLTVIPSISTAVESMTELLIPMGDMLDKTSDKWATFKEGFQSLIPVTETVQQAFVGMAEIVSQSLADVLTGDTVMFFDNIINALIAAAKSLGKVLIAIGGAMVLTGVLAGPGGMLLAGGAALLTLGAIGSNLVAGRTAQREEANALTASLQRQDINISGMLQGRDIALSNRRGVDFQTAIT